ncbi:MAG: hypothetical protein Q4D38_12750, partial [Planctomycetia bacterium]|nr:hypothetical protein [Planctomycetia bacterium]
MCRVRTFLSRTFLLFASLLVLGSGFFAAPAWGDVYWNSPNSGFWDDNSWGGDGTGSIYIGDGST